MYSADPNDKVRRKRVLISSDFRTAYRKKNIYDVFVELNQSNWVTDQANSNAFKKFYQRMMHELSAKYENGIVYKQPPSVKKRKSIEPRSAEDCDLDEDEEQRLKN